MLQWYKIGFSWVRRQAKKMGLDVTLPAVTNINSLFNNVLYAAYPIQYIAFYFIVLQPYYLRRYPLTTYTLA